MAFTYRTRRRTRRFFTTALWLILLLAVAWCIWMVWLHRYVVYTRDGVELDFRYSSQEMTGEIALPPPAAETVSIYYNEGADKIETGTQLPQLAGIYVNTDALLHDLGAVRRQIEALPPGSAVMLDLKSIYGNFFYSSQTEGAELSGNVDIAAMDDLLAWLKTANLYTIARIPAFRDRSFGLYAHNSGTPCGLPEAAGNLWEDSEGCYWLDPAARGTKEHLAEIINELRLLGFDEVVFTEFTFPDSGGRIVYETEQSLEDILKDTASELVNVCSTSSFAVSFQAAPDFPLPLGRSRLYLTGIPADQVDDTLKASAVSDPLLNLVFLADSNDTRYNESGNLRQLNIGQ